MQRMPFFFFSFQKVKIMEAPNATAASASPPFLKPTVSKALAAPIHRKARILTRDPLREVEDDSMELQVEDDVRRLVFLRGRLLLCLKKKNIYCEKHFRSKRRRAHFLSTSVSPGSRDAPGRV